MNIEIRELKKEDLEKYPIEEFLFKMIKESYDLDYVPEYHYDIKDLNKYYITPNKNNFFVALDADTDSVIGTCAIRGYDRKDQIKNRNYTIENTASIYRLFVEKRYRHNKIATKLVQKIEEFCKEKEYNEIYLHTQKGSYGALPFWLSQKYQIVDDTKDSMGTVHMEKPLKEDFLRLSSLKIDEKISSY
ncbi:MAG: GNAT family N-acetyltransferase [Methanosphaera sp. rholeuAM270]|nr:MAG: GNAT family N-acetyltransferase [Methanosphaera sp. rholeuAM270]